MAERGLRVVVAGLGVQGEKRRRVAGRDVVAVVDPVAPGAEYKSVVDVPRERYDAVLACIPDSAKLEMLEYLLSHGKHVLVEKPLVAPDRAAIDRLVRLASESGAVCYTAYNHRFEPHFVRMRDAIASGELGEIYRIRMFYGNGTARLVRSSEWRDQGAGVLPDLGSHLLDTLHFWLGREIDGFGVREAHRFENRAFDHVVLASAGPPAIELEMTLLSWRNHFTCDVLAERGTAHIESLCKWGPSTFTLRRRVLPSGRPPEESETLVRADPTWEAEYDAFAALCANGGPGNTANDIWINDRLGALSREALEEKP